MDLRPHGVISRRDACLQIFRSMQPNDWVSTQELTLRVIELTNAEVEWEVLHPAAWQAEQTLAKEREIGVAYVNGGYKRLLPQEQVSVTERRLVKTRRALRRTVHHAAAAAANPALDHDSRNRMMNIQLMGVAQKNLEARRAKKRRPELTQGGE